VRNSNTVGQIDGGERRGSPFHRAARIGLSTQPLIASSVLHFAIHLIDTIARPFTSHWRDLGRSLSGDISGWLDGQRFEPDVFRCTTDDERITCRLEFKVESEATACAETFGGELRPMGSNSVQ
jgi:hypothetical protein